jgi:hypothetical protein
MISKKFLYKTKFLLYKIIINMFNEDYTDKEYEEEEVYDDTMSGDMENGEENGEYAEYPGDLEEYGENGEYGEYEEYEEPEKKSDDEEDGDDVNITDSYNDFRKKREEDEDYVVPEYEEKAERNVFERVGYTDELFNISSEDIRLRDPKTIFRIKVNAISLDIMKNTNAINKDDIRILISKISSLKYVEFKNPTGYVLGYIVTDGGKRITKKNVDFVFKTILPTVQDKSVKEPDVIRYSRLWLTL